MLLKRSVVMGDVNVRFYGFFIDLVGKRQMTVKFEGAMSLQDILAVVDSKTDGRFIGNVIDPITRKLRSHVIVMLNKTTRLSELDVSIKEKDELAFFPVSGGG